MYGRPGNATNEVLWQKAVRENPDSSWLVVPMSVDLNLIDPLPAWSLFLPLDSMICKKGWTPRRGKLPHIRKNFRWVLNAKALPAPF